MTGKKVSIIMLIMVGFSSLFLSSSYSEILKPLSRSQLKKFETELFCQAKELQAGPLPAVVLEKGRELLDALIKKENHEQFQKTVERYFLRKLIHEKQKDRFLKKNDLRKNLAKAAEAAKNHKKKALLAAYKELQHDLEEMAQDDQCKEENAQRYTALKHYTALIGYFYTAAYLGTFIKNSYELQLTNEVLSIVYLLGKLGSYILIDSTPKAGLLKSFTDALQEVDLLYNFIPEKGKLPVHVAGIAAAAIDYLPALQKIAAELRNIPLEQVMM